MSSHERFNKLNSEDGMLPSHVRGNKKGPPRMFAIAVRQRCICGYRLNGKYSRIWVPGMSAFIVGEGDAS